MNLIAVFDSIALVGFLVAFVAAFAVPAGEGRRFDTPAKVVLVLAMLLYVSVAASNVLEHGGITSEFDSVEDYLEVAFFPLLAYVVYALDVGGRIERLRETRRELQRERDLTMSVIDASPAAILMVSGDGTLRFVSERARILFGLPDGAEARAEDVRLRPYGRSAGGGPQQNIADLAAHAPIRDELFMIDVGPNDCIVSASAGVAGTDAGETVVALVDVTDRLKVDAELAAYRRDLEGQVEQRTEQLTHVNLELERANRAKQDFLSKMSHELRTPLNSIIGFTGVMLRGMAGEITDEQRTQLEMVERAGSRLLSVVNDVLDISKIEAGQASVSLRPSQLHAVVATLVGEMRPIARERNITLVYANESTRHEVRTDPDKVEQIVRNLVSNALKFTPENGEVEVVVADQTSGISVSVRDTGEGMTAEEKAKIFEPFYQGDKGTNDVVTGTGLGLAIAAELAELVGAHITVSSAPGEGSTFKLLIPA